ncbi:hypothetical protein NQ315_009117 [Exocentrus adspersus]|uniref:EGF-like domain-containing protein n=1 Tax=Exocentrus adspersus TaxID=1586481 RepID=A0AAV8WFT6_9CUCU|nr:hypothetical protein NQ315_009117 [Exocentrus adspersus]
MISKLLIFLCIIVSSCCNDQILLRTRTSFLERYRGYSNVIIVHFKVPQNTLLASFKFMADETRMSIFDCPSRNVSLFLKYGSPPVINPDGSPFPKIFKNITRSKLYASNFQTDKKEVYINITSPEPGSYYAATFLSYRDPRFNSITQQGLSPSCYASVEAMLYARKIELPIIITENDVIEVSPLTNENRYFKFFVPNINDHSIMTIQELSFSKDAESLLVQIETGRPPSEESFQNEEVFYPNTSYLSFQFSVTPATWHYIKIKIQNTTTQNILEGLSVVRFRLRLLSNILPPDTSSYSVLENETSSENSTFKLFHNNKVTDMIPYIQYDLLREASTDSFVFSFELIEEMDSNIAIPLNMTNEHFSLLKFDIYESSDIGGTLQFILAFKPKISRKNAKLVWESEPEDHVVIACIGRQGIEIPTWPNLCVSNGVEKPAQLMLNKSVDNTSVLIPFPESGTWYATFKLFCGKCESCNCSDSCHRQYQECTLTCELDCADDSNCSYCFENCRNDILELDDCVGCNCDGPCLKNENVTCNSSIIFDVGSKPCLLGQCSKNGRCMFMVSDGIVFSTCVCSNRYRGWDCSDGSQATPYCMVVLELLLLVLSNLMFLPASYIAFRRKYYIESVTYFSICFFSTFYHACDAGENIISYCLVRLSALQFGDFFCALLAIWVTIIAIADLSPLVTSMCHMAGAIILAFCTNIDRTALWIFTFPVLIGVAIMSVSWYLKYKKIRQRFVQKRYIYVNIPVGTVLVAVGLTMYAFLQTEDNYKYLHSLWHIIMAVAIIIVLPKQNTFIPDVLL